MLHISIRGMEAFSGVLSGDGPGILGPLWQRGHPPVGGYGVRLIRLWWRQPEKARFMIDRILFWILNQIRGVERVALMWSLPGDI